MNTDRHGLGPGGELLLYQAEGGRIRIETRLQDETIWLSMNQMAELFDVDKSGISRHLKSIFESGELARGATVAKFATVQKEGARTISRDVAYYNLDAIISVGYRVNSIRGTQFRMWATERLKEYIVKGFALDDRRLKDEPKGGRYFEELLARIRDIRSSEKVFWRKVLDIYATSINYDPKAETSRRFFQQVQNKMHWAAHGHTAAEVIFGRADAALIDALKGQFREAFDLLAQAVGSFAPEQWASGGSPYNGPGRAVAHALVCAEFYTCGERAAFERFGMPIWKMGDSDVPDQQTQKQYLTECREKTLAWIESSEQDGLAITDASGATALGRIVYALRHLQHHTGEVFAYQKQMGIAVRGWD